MLVLVADDDLDQLTLRCMILEKSGFRTVQAADARIAVGLAKSEKPDCAVVDLCFPTEKSGLRLVRELKALDPAMRVIVLTGARLAIVTEADGILEKGAGSAALVRALRRLQQRTHG